MNRGGWVRAELQRGARRNPSGKEEHVGAPGPEFRLQLPPRSLSCSNYEMGDSQDAHRS